MKIAQKSSLLLLCAYASGIVVSAAFSVPVVDAASSASTSTSTSTLDTIWNKVPEGPPDAILGIAQSFRDSREKNKVNVCVGAYRDENGQPWVLPSVRQAEEIMLKGENKEYLPIEGDQAFVEKALKFAYGANAPIERIAGVQSLSGTGVWVWV
jgi:aspartate aminotransferase